VNPFLHKLRWWIERRRKEDEIREELQFHLDEEADRSESDGLTSDEARRAARRDLGNLTLVEENVRAISTFTWLEQLAQDVRYAARTMLDNRTFTCLAVFSLALGIGANTAIYSFVDSILLRSLPVKDPESLVVLNWRAKDPRVPGQPWRPFVMHSMSGSAYNDKVGLTSGIFPFPALERFEHTDTVFSSVFGYYPAGDLNVMVGGGADRVTGEYVSGDYFRGLEVAPIAGRMVVREDDRADAPAVVVVSADFSQRYFGGPATATGQSIRISNVPFTVIGVAPPDFFGVDPARVPDLYLPMHTNLLVNGRGLNSVTPETYLDQNYYWINIMGRLRPGVTLAGAENSLAMPFRQWVAGTAANDEERANLPSLLVTEGAAGLDSLRRQYSKPLYVLLVLVGLILAIACANIANLQLARASARQREMAVRLSIGAGRLRVIRQLLTESSVLALLGGGFGIVFAIWGVRFLTFLLANGQEHFTLRAELNWHVLSATLVASLVCGVLFGLAPAIQSTRPDVMPTLKQIRATGSPVARRRLSLGHVLVVSQIALSLLLLVAAGLFVRTLSNLQSVQLGFNRENVLLFELNARQAGHDEPEIATFYASLRTRLKAIPGVRNATLSHASLLGAGRQLPIEVSGVKAEGTRILNAGPDFFSTMQIPMTLGREIDERDQPGSPPVAVVNELFARTYFGEENPLGRHLTLGGPSPRDMEIVGVSANVRYQGVKEKLFSIVFIPYNQGAFPPVMDMTYALRTAGDPLAYVKTVRDVVHQADARIPVTGVKTQAAEIDQNINQEIVFARLCTGFGVLALIIACVGLYGTMAYTVARRTGEIGIRMALGARRISVVAMVMRQVLVLAAVGLSLSVPAALVTSKFVESFLFGMKPNDPGALTAAAGVLLGAALLAGFLPARRASRIDPITALRHE
jgi:macrolide transport system ATP-binding/permease protein